jgi:hypothetical protein
MLTKRRTVVPIELDESVAGHASAFSHGDERAAERFVVNAALEAHRAAFARSSALSAPREFEVLARARLGLHYVVKVRFHRDGREVALQNRWRREPDGTWRIVEVEDLGLRSPWTKPEKTQPLNGNA